MAIYTTIEVLAILKHDESKINLINYVCFLTSLHRIDCYCQSTQTLHRPAASVIVRLGGEQLITLTQPIQQMSISITLIQPIPMSAITAGGNTTCVGACHIINGNIVFIHQHETKSWY